MSAQILYPAGTVMSSNYPLVHVLHERYKSHYCDQCFKKSSSLKKCSGCGKMFYCDGACQKLDWKGKHKYECSYANFAELDHVDRLNNRLYLAMKNPTSLHRKFFFRPSNNDAGDESKAFTLMDLYKQTQGCDEIVLELNETIAPHIRSILDEDFEEIGYGLYVAEACSTGYSCAPNAVPSFVGTRADLRAMTDLRVGQPITTGMNLYLTPRIERRAMLMSECRIDCHCELCEDDRENDFDFIGFAQMKKRCDELREAYKGNHDLDCLSEYIVLMKRFYLLFKQRCKYHHPGLTQCLLSIYLATRSLSRQDVNIALTEFDLAHPDLYSSSTKSMTITHDPSHKTWEFCQNVLFGDALLRFFSF